MNATRRGGRRLAVAAAMDDTGWSTTPGTQRQIWDCTGNANQQWKLP